MINLVLVVFVGVVQIHAEDVARLFPPETRSITGVEVSRIRMNSRWPLLLDIARLWRRYEDPAPLTGFDPSIHLDELALLKVGGSARGELVVLRGRFDASHVAHFDPANQDGHETRYRGVRVCAPLHETRGYLQWTASIGDMVVIGPADVVRTAIDTYVAAEARRAWFDGGLARVRGKYDAWMVGRRTLPTVPNGPPRSELEWSGGIRLDARPSAEGELVALSPELAQGFAVSLRESIDPKREASHLWRMATDSVRISADQRTVRVTAELDWEPLLVLMARSSGL